MKKLSVLMGTAVVGAVLLVAIVTTATLAQDIGPGNMGPEVMGAQGWMQCVVPYTSTQPFSLTAQGIFGYGQSGQGSFGPGMMCRATAWVASTG